jgi:hypothetical protein
MAWEMRFRGRPIMFFTCTPGFHPSPRPVIAQCEIKDQGGVSACLLYLTREHGRIHWEVETRPDEPPVPLGNGEIFIDIISEYARRALMRYQPSR